MNIAISEYKPSASLWPFVQSYWYGDFNITNQKAFAQSVVPNGCIELIIHLNDAHCSLSKDENQWNSSPEFTMLGLHTRPYEVRFLKRVNVFGIRFFPDGIRNIFGVAPASFLATYEDGIDVLGKKLVDFCARIQASGNIAAQLELANDFMTSQLQRHYRSYDYTHKAMKIVRSVNEPITYRHLVDQIPISERQLQREFRNQYGITVQEYMRLARMNAIYTYLQSGMNRLYANLDFFDQSHFIREFRNYVGLAPRKFMRNREKFIVNPA